MSFVTTRYLLIFVLLASSLLLASSRVIGGKEADPSKYPFFVNIYWEDNRTPAPTVSLSPTETFSPTWAPTEPFPTPAPTETLSPTVTLYPTETPFPTWEDWNPDFTYSPTFPCPTLAPGPGIPEAASNDPELSIFVEIIDLLDLAGALSSCGQITVFTVFAPTDAAFEEVIDDVNNLEALDPNILYELFSYHVVYDLYLSSDITDGLVLPTAQGETIEFQVNGDNISVNEKGFVGTEILASNGVIHKIDGVMFPDSFVTSSPSSTPIDDDATFSPSETPTGFPAFCGGTLIAPDIVLTAAHCSPDPDDSGVVDATDPALTIYVYSYANGFQYRTCVEWINDPQWESIGDPDFALCKLDTPFDIDESLVSLEVNDKSTVPADDAMLTVIGTGYIDAFFTLPGVLQEVDVPTMSNEECAEKPFLNYRDYIFDTLICTGYFEGEDGTEDIINGLSPNSCQGDSGGPLLERTELENGKVVYSLVGVVSWGTYCGVLGLPSVYARVSSGFDWISATACPMSESDPSFCKPPIQSKKGKASKKKGKKGKHDKKGKKSKKSPKSSSSSSEDSPEDDDQTIPPTPTIDSITEIIAKFPFLSTFATAFEAADIDEFVWYSCYFGGCLVIAPTDDAFDELPSNALPCLLKPENKDVLKDILLYHLSSFYENWILDFVFPGYPSPNPGDTATTLQGEDITITVDETGGPPIYGVNNGKLYTNIYRGFDTPDVIVTTDTVLFPPSLDIIAFLDDFCD